MAINEKVGVNLVADTKSLREQLRDATQDLIKLQNTAGATGEQIAAAASKAADLRDRIGDAKDTISGFDPDAKFKALGQALQGVVGAFAAVQGGLALVGVESAEVEKQLLKVQGAIALSEGLNTVLSSIDGFKNLGLVIQETTLFQAAYNFVLGEKVVVQEAEVLTTTEATVATTANTAATIAATTATTAETTATVAATTATTASTIALRAFRFALLATGVGALVLLLVTLVQNFDRIKNSISNTFPNLIKFGNLVGSAILKVTDFIGITSEADRSFDKFSKASERRRENLQGELKILEASGASEKILTDKRKQLVNEELSTLDLKRKTKKKLSDEEEKKARELANELLVIDAKYNKSLADATKKNTDEANKKILDANKEKNDKIAQQNKEARDTEFEEFLSSNEKRIARLSEFNKSDKTDFEKKLIDLRDQYDTDLKLFSDSEIGKALAKKTFDEAVFKATKEEKKRISELEDKEADDKIKKLDKQREKKEKEDLKTASMLTKAVDKSIKTSKDQSDQLIKISDAEKEAKINNLRATADVFGALAGLAEQGTATQKALSLAQVAINTGIAISNLVATSSAPTPDNVATGGISGFAKYAAGIITILSNIAQAKSIIDSVPGGGGGSSAGISSVGAGAGAPIAPRSAEPIATTLDQTSLNSINNVVTRAYVVESDITGSQKRIERIEKASRF